MIHRDVVESMLSHSYQRVLRELGKPPPSCTPKMCSDAIASMVRVTRDIGLFQKVTPEELDQLADDLEEGKHDHFIASLMGYM